MTTSWARSSAGRSSGSRPKRDSRRATRSRKCPGRPRRRWRGGRTLTKTELHEELRQRVNADLMPWCRGCKSHHVAPMLWRYATISVGAGLDSERRYRAAKPGRAPAGARGGRALPSLLRALDAECLRGLGRRRQTSRRASVEPRRRRPGGGAGGQAHRLAAQSRPSRARVACRGGRNPPDPAGGPVPPEAEPPVARTGCGASQTAVQAGGKPGRGASARAAGGPVAGEGKGEEGRGERREARADRASRSRGRGSARGSRTRRLGGGPDRGAEPSVRRGLDVGRQLAGCAVRNPDSHDVAHREHARHAVPVDHHEMPEAAADHRLGRPLE